MEFILQDIEKCLENGLYFVALQSALTLPDICGALENDSDIVKTRYIKWYDANMQGKSILSAEDCYAFRNGMIHRAFPKHQKMNYDRVIFFHPDYSTIISGDNNIINNTAWINLVTFCRNIVEAVRIWEQKMRDTNNPDFIKNYPNLIRVHPTGISPYMGGFPVIG